MLYSNSKWNFTKRPNQVILVQILWNFSWDVPVCKEFTRQLVQNALYYLSQSLYMISRPLDKIRDFSISFEFYIIFYLSTTQSSSWYKNQMQENCASFHVHGLRDVSWTWIPFFEQFALWFYALAVHIRRIRNKYRERSEIVTYNKQRQNDTNFEHVHCMSVCGSWKKFGLKMWSFFGKFAVSRVKTLTEDVMLSAKVLPCHVYFFSESHVRLALGEFNWRRRPLRLRRWRRQLNPSPRAESRMLSAKWLLTWASPSPRAGPCALGEERLHRELVLWLSAKVLVHGENSFR
jgi:hypothetical protein